MKFTAKDVEIMARTIYGEARGESPLGKKAVGHVLINRARRGGWFGKTVSQCALYPQQFSCWNQNDPNRVKMQGVDLGDPLYRECMLAALEAMGDPDNDPTHGSHHYHTHNVSPKWSKGHSYLSIGGHRFYSGIA